VSVYLEFGIDNMALGSPVVGFRDGIFEVEEFRKGSFFLSDLSLQHKYNRKWFMLVYVPAYHIGYTSSWGNLKGRS
jgi:hypothetical protein